MSGRLSAALALLFCLSFSICLAALAPASILLSRVKAQVDYVDFAESRGTVWDGGAQSVLLYGVPIGDVTFSLSVFPRDGFGPALTWRSQGGSQQSGGVFKIDFGDSLFAQDVSASLSLASLSLPLNVDGRLSLDLDQGQLESGSCEVLVGEISVSGSLASLNQEAIDLSGPLSCENGSIQALLSGAVGSMAANLRLTYQFDRSVTYTAVLRGGDQTTASILLSLGFQRNGSAYELSGQTSLN